MWPRPHSACGGGRAETAMAGRVCGARPSYHRWRAAWGRPSLAVQGPAAARGRVLLASATGVNVAPTPGGRWELLQPGSWACAPYSCNQVPPIGWCPGQLPG